MGPAIESNTIPYGSVASDEDKKLMKYHGTLVSGFDNETGEKYFFRDGKKMKLAYPRRD